MISELKIYFAGLFLIMAGFAQEYVFANETRGEKIYQQNCMVCHDDDGSSVMPGVPALTKKDAWLLEPEQQLLLKLKRGIQTPGAAISMPPKGGNPELSDAELMAAITYIRAVLLEGAPKNALFTHEGQ